MPPLRWPDTLRPATALTNHRKLNEIAEVSMTDRATITTSDGCRLAYRFDGPVEAPVLVLSNSLGTGTDMWNPQMARFAAVRRVLRYDSRGHGGSDAPTGDYSLDRLGMDVVDLADDLGVGKLDFCGLSMGGMVGQWLGVNAPDRLSRAVFANTAAYMGPPSGWDARIAIVKAEGMASIAGAIIERWFTPEFCRDPRRVQSVLAMLLATDPRGYAGCCAAIRDMDQRSAVKRIAAPTLVISGTKDPATPTTDAAFLAREIPNAALVMLEAAHLSNIEQPDAFADAVLKHLIA